MCLSARAQRLVDEFNEGAEILGRGTTSVRHGIAAVLRHIADTETDEESFYSVPSGWLYYMQHELSVPTLLDKALNGDTLAAKEFLRRNGFTDADGQLLPQYRAE